MTGTEDRSFSEAKAIISTPDVVHAASCKSIDTRNIAVQHVSLLASRTLQFLQHYYPCYVTYLLVIIVSGACALMVANSEALTCVDALYLSVSAVTMTGLSPIDFGASSWNVHFIIWILIVLGSPMLLSIVPVVLRYRYFGQAERGQHSDFADLDRVAAKDERSALAVIFKLVLVYWLSSQILGCALIWAILPEHGCFHAMFLSTSAFHNAGLVSIPVGLPFSETACAIKLLVVVMILILSGNSCFPISLRVLVSAKRRLSRDEDERRALGLLLRFPRACYTHLFPENNTRWLAFITPLLIVVQFLALCVADMWAVPANGRSDAEIFVDLSWDKRMIATSFQSVSTRTAGFSVVNLELLSLTSSFIFCVCMWISVCPVVVVMRSTALEDKRHADVRNIKDQMGTFMSQNSVLLGGLFFGILLAEQYASTAERDGYDQFRYQFMNILFEFCSAYGTVGLSMSDQPWSYSKQYSLPAKFILMFVMLLGRLRGLPESIDPAVNFREWAEMINDDVREDCQEGTADFPPAEACPLDQSQTSGCFPCGAPKPQARNSLWYAAYTHGEGLPLSLSDKPLRVMSEPSHVVSRAGLDGSSYDASALTTYRSGSSDDKSFLKPMSHSSGI